MGAHLALQKLAIVTSPTTTSVRIDATMDSTSCMIPSDPDIAGVGVRTAIYIQNLFTFVPAIWALWDGKVSAYDLESVESHSTTILVTAFAILISAVGQAHTLGLSVFHASIVLSLSWMNNTNTFIYFLLYVKHKSQANDGDSVEPTFDAWYEYLRKRMHVVLPTKPFGMNLLSDDSVMGKHELSFQDSDISSIKLHQVSNKSSTSLTRKLLRKAVFLLGSLHLTVMAAFGLWVWTDPRFFKTGDSCAVDTSEMSILGIYVPCRSRGLHGWSIAIYTLFLVPGLNLILPMGLFLAIFTLCHKWHASARRVKLLCRRVASLRIMPVWISMSMLLIINIVFLVDIELTIYHNRERHEDNGESQWTFGQTLALLLLSMPLRDLIETSLSRREHERDRQARTLPSMPLPADAIDGIELMIQIRKTAQKQKLL
ncbi:hypothetical protein CYLTODRAFT_377592 [Cylindrobasidium torrendii FP15055 ss-10]|uniref:Uncharacterized protein n=1 Tax=Cylindrobasidium torrendii FP15055 ss-10 TaxID=1314674 RepID=A0A0D7BAJ3_9AGAR|nr:hypothetical protein CYLTODRAFT_377592 [Cylindrobasidium torrendii FP15055 ss-10]